MGKEKMRTACLSALPCGAAMGAPMAVSPSAVSAPVVSVAAGGVFAADAQRRDAASAGDLLHNADLPADPFPILGGAFAARIVGGFVVGAMDFSSVAQHFTRFEPGALALREIKLGARPTREEITKDAALKQIDNDSAAWRPIRGGSRSVGAE
jgi:hypothetical protein